MFATNRQKRLNRTLGSSVGVILIALCSYALGQPLNDPIQRGGNLSISAIQVIDTLDIHSTLANLTTALQLMYENLVRATVDGDTGQTVFEPELATDWQFLEEENAVVFHLRRGVLFHDGSPFNAEVAKWNLDRLVTEPTSQLLGPLGEIIESTEVVDDYTVRVNVEAPSNTLMLLLSSHVQSGFMSMKLYEELGREAFAQVGSGTGPFKFKERVVGDHIVLERFDDYWRLGEDGQALPYLDTVTQYVRPDVNIAALQLRAGALDIVTYPDARAFELVERDPNLEIATFGAGYRQYVTMPLNMVSGAFTDIRLREAATLAVDRQRILEMFSPQIGFLAPYHAMYEGYSGWNPSEWPDYSFDLQRARQLVAEVGGHPKVTIKVIGREPDVTIAALIKSMWDDAGFDTEILSLERLTWIDDMRANRYDTGISTLTNYPIVDLVWLRSVVTGGPANWGNYSNPAVDELVQLANREQDSEKHAELYTEAGRLLYEDFAIYSVYGQPESIIKRKNVHFGPLSALHGGFLDLTDTWISR